MYVYFYFTEIKYLSNNKIAFLEVEILFFILISIQFTFDLKFKCILLERITFRIEINFGTNFAFATGLKQK